MKAKSNLSFRFDREGDRIECSCWFGKSRVSTCYDWCEDFDFLKVIFKKLPSKANNPAYGVAFNLCPAIKAAWTRDYAKFKNTRRTSRKLNKLRSGAASNRYYRCVGWQ